MPQNVLQNAWDESKYDDEDNIPLCRHCEESYNKTKETNVAYIVL